MTTLIQLRRGTAAQWALANTLLAEGEVGLVTDTGQYKIGDGVTLWNDLPFTVLTGAFTALDLTATTDPGATAAGHMALYAKTIGGRVMPKIVGPSGLDTPLQPLVGSNKIGGFCPQGNAATATIWGCYIAPTAIGTATTRAVATTNLFTRMRRLGFVSTAVAGNLCGARVAAAQVTTGTGANDGSGFFKKVRFGISDAVLVAAGARTFVGVSFSTGAPTNVEPSTLTNCVGVGNRAADTNLHIFYGGSAAQAPINLGPNFPSNTVNTDVYDLTLFAPPNSGDVYYEVTRLNTGHVAAGLLLSAGGVALPSPTTLITYMQAWRTNNVTAAAVGLDIMSDYVETDF